MKLHNVLFLQRNVTFSQFYCTNDSLQLSATTLQMWPTYTKRLWKKDRRLAEKTVSKKKKEMKTQTFQQTLLFKAVPSVITVHASSTRTSTLQMKVAHKIDVVSTYSANPLPQNDSEARSL